MASPFDPGEAPDEEILRADIPKGLGDLLGFSAKTKGIFGALSNSLSEIAAGFGADVKSLQLGRSLEDARARISALLSKGKKQEDTALDVSNIVSQFTVASFQQGRSKEQTQEDLGKILPGTSPASSINNTMFPDPRGEF